MFSPEFKLEAVQLMRERRAAGASLSQIARELALRPDLLRARARQVPARPGAGARGVVPGPSPEAEVRRLQRENAVLRQGGTS